MSRKPTLQETEPQFRETIGRMLEGRDHGLVNPRPAIDLQQAKEFRAEQIQGRKEEAYVTALEAHGFRFAPDAELAARGRAPTGEGLWYHPSQLYKLAFTPGEILAGFPTPEEFYRWVMAHKRGKELQRQKERGLVTPAEARQILANMRKVPG